MFTLLASLSLLLTGCGAPHAHVARLAAESGFVRLDHEERAMLPRGDAEPERLPYAAWFKPGERGPLRVYLEGDGRPWRSRYLVAADPTPRTPVMLALAQLDNGPVLYLGRPCYFGGATAAPCAPPLWTSHRYSARVVKSLSAALARSLARIETTRDARGRVPLLLLGHSGGGTLAMLLAEQLVAEAGTARPLGVVTLAANLDVAAWAAHHGYTPLHGSLDPAKRPPLALPQWHHVGERDTQVPPSLTRAGAHPAPHVRIVAHPEADHHCCWAAHWPAIVATALASVPH